MTARSDHKIWEDIRALNTKVRHLNVYVGTSIVQVPSSSLEHRAYLKIVNESPGIVYIGDDNVSAAAGYPLASSGSIELPVGPEAQVFAISSHDNTNLRILEIA